MLGSINGQHVDHRTTIKCRLTVAGGLDEQNLGGIELTALVDTGCTDFMIPPRIAEQLSLVEFETGENHTAGGVITVSAYRVPADPRASS